MVWPKKKWTSFVDLFYTNLLNQLNFKTGNGKVQ